MLCTRNKENSNKKKNKFQNILVMNPENHINPLKAIPIEFCQLFSVKNDIFFHKNDRVLSP